ncbi:hypothetical protein [Methyloglobulus sp.]|uniref:hypothetical protein n=1 Tax=Methyloglobulus sp. TaxID=2518622 RepID=UPI0032B822AC
MGLVLLRQYLPKGEDLSVFTQEDLDAIAWSLNTRSHKSLGFKCPAELFTPDAFDLSSIMLRYLRFKLESARLFLCRKLQLCVLISVYGSVLDMQNHGKLGKLLEMPTYKQVYSVKRVIFG